MNSPNFFAELKQRKLVQWALAYVAAAFALLQGIDIVASRFGWPEQTMRFVIIALSVGFFATLVLAWYHGERGAQRVTGTELLILALLLALGGGFLWQFGGSSHGRVVRSDASPAAIGGSPLPAAITEKSIAVLPFENLSDDKQNAYFAEGVQDEVLTRLAKVADLKVISRTSTEHFRSSPDNLPAIARQLGVLHILEGSVQKSGDAVRVNVQLINALTDAHLWAEIYDRKLTDIFTVESDIAKTIAETLQAKLSGSEKTAMSKKPTTNQAAYELYLQGRFLWNKRAGPEIRKSVDCFNKAIAQDPDYAQAYAGLAQSWTVMSSYNGGSPADSFPQAQAAAMKAIALDETSSDALTVLASYKALYEFDYAGALEQYERVLQLDPNNATAHHWLAVDTLACTGHCERELAEMERAVELDPLSLIITCNLGLAYMHNGRLDDAMAQLRKAIALDGSFYIAHSTYATVLAIQRKIPEAIAEMEKSVAMTDDPAALGQLGQLYGMAGRKGDAQNILSRLRSARDQHYTAAYALALVALGLGDNNEALNWLEQSYRDHAGDSIGYIRVDPLLAPLHGNPRFEALAETIVPARLFKGAAAPK